MKKVIKITTILISLIVIAAGAFAGTANSFTITDNGWSYTESNLLNQRTGTNGGLANFVYNGGQDNMSQNWWWYRTICDSREYALSNQVQLVTGANVAELVYYESLADGTIPNALEIRLRYTLTGFSPEHAQLKIDWTVRNLSEVCTPFEFFAYTDPGWGTGAIGTLTNNNFIEKEILIEDTDNPRRLLLTAQMSNLVGWEIAKFPQNLNQLADGDIDNLLNATTPLGPGNVTAAFQWSYMLPQHGVASGTFIKDLTIPEAHSLLLALPGLASIGIWRRRKS